MDNERDSKSLLVEKKEIDILGLLAEDRALIKYRPSLRKLAGSVTATILLQQCIYWWNKQGRKKFYKFKNVCGHKKYKEGDSWCEELSFSREEFDTAIKQIGFKRGKTQNKISMEKALVIYYTDKEGLTWYELNEVSLVEKLENTYSKKNDLLFPNKSVNPTFLNQSVNPTSLNQSVNPTSLSFTETTTEITSETTKEDDSLRSSSYRFAPQTRDEKTNKREQEINNVGVDIIPDGKISQPDRVAEAIQNASEKSLQARERKVEKPRKIVQNANTITAYFDEKFRVSFGGVAPLEGVKDKALMKKMIEHYGYDSTVRMIDWMFRNWAKFSRECRVTSVPTVGVFFGFRGYLQNNVTVEPEGKGGPDNVWGV